MRLIFCNDCAHKYMDENGEPTEIYWARFGPQGSDGDEEVLVCGTAPHPLLRLFEAAWKYVPCDGCGEDVVVSQSSYWFLEDRLDLRKQ